MKRVAAVVLGLVGWTSLAWGQVPTVPAPRVLGRPIARPGQPAAASTSEPTSEENAAEATVEPNRTAKPLPPKFITLHLLDGNIISGNLSVNEITVDTQFGELVVPIEKIRSFTPGLDSYPKLAAEIEQHIKDLGSDDYKTREEAHKALAAKGISLRSELERYADDENAEIKRHVGEILKELDERAEDGEDLEEGSQEQPWIRLDTVVTTDFTVIGQVSPRECLGDSKYGPLTVALADVKQGERRSDVKESIRKSLTVTGENLAQRKFKASGVRVEAGDKIAVKAEGSLIMSPWGSNAASGPDGAPNYGWYIPSQISGGTLVARIGDKGTVFKVGRQSNFVAKSSGVLQFAIGMQGEYANEGYQFPGEYRLRVKVDPK
jgi:hypothetical protein